MKRNTSENTCWSTPLLPYVCSLQCESCKGMDDGSEQDSTGGEEGEGEGEGDTLGVTTVLDLSNLRVRLSHLNVYTTCYCNSHST